MTNAGRRWLLLAMIATARVAAAHHATADLRVTLDPPSPRLAGVTVQLRHTLADQLVIENRTSRALEVLDDDGAPFLRLGPGGAEANLAAPAWYASLAPDGVPLPSRVRPGASPAWTRIARTPSWGWFDRRLRVDTPSRRPARTDGAPHRRWRIALRYGDEIVGLRGRFRRPSPARGVFVARFASALDPLPDVHLTLVPGRVPAILLRNDGDQPVEVLGADDEPFVRVGRDGSFVNLRSATWRRSGRAPADPAPDDGDAPRWERQSAAARFAWVDPRAAVPGDARGGGGRRAVGYWTLPLRQGEHAATVAGVIEWLPTVSAE